MRTTRLACLLSLLLVGSLRAQPLRHPDATLQYVYPAGARQGATVEIELGGLDGINGANAVLVEGAPGVTVRDLKPHKIHRVGALSATLVVAPDAPVGKRLLRVRGGSAGLTNARPFFVGRLPEVVEKDANDTPESAQEIALPTVVNGRIEAMLDADCYAFRARPGQKVVAAVLAHGMDSLHNVFRMIGFLDASLDLLDDKGRVVAAAADTLGLDPVLEHTVKDEGRYVLRVSSVLHRGSLGAVYRLTVGDIPYPTHVFPGGGQRGQKVEVEVLGTNVATGTKLTVSVPALEGRTGSVPLSVPFDHPLSDGRELPYVAGDLVEVRESAKHATLSTAQTLTLGSVVNGRIDRPGEDDWYRLPLKKGQGVVLAVMAQRHLRSAVDSLLEVYNAAGQKLADNDDGIPYGLGNSIAHDFPSSDSWLAFTAPADGDYFVRLADQGDAHGSQALYRLSATNLEPDFELHQWPDAVPIWGAGSTAAFLVHMHFWGGLDTDIQVRVEGLPQGWTGSTAIIPVTAYRQFIAPYGYQALLTITAPANATAGTVVPFRVVGRVEQGGKVLERTSHPLTLYGGGPSKRRHFRSTPQSWAVVGPSQGILLSSPVQEVTVRLNESVQVPVRIQHLGDNKGEIGVTIDGPFPGSAAATAWTSPLTLKPGQTEATLTLTVGGKRQPGTYGVVISRSWSSDMRVGRPGPCTPIIRLNVLPPKTAQGNPPGGLKALAALAMGLQNADEVSRLIAQLRDRSPAERAKAGRDLAQLGPKDGKAVAPLIAVLDDDSELVRQTATGALTRIGKAAVPGLTEALQSSRRWTRRQATLALAHIGADAKPAAAALSRLLQDSDRDIRAFAALALVKIDPSNRETLPLVIKGLDVAEKELRISTLYTLEQVGFTNAEVRAAFAKGLRDADKEVRITAASILARGGDGVRELTEELVKALSDAEVSVRISVAAALAALESDKSKEAVPVLMAALKDREVENRRGAAFVLGQFGSAARPALAALTAALKDDSAEVRQAARTALKQIEAKP